MLGEIREKLLFLSTFSVVSFCSMVSLTTPRSCLIKEKKRERERELTSYHIK